MSVNEHKNRCSERKGVTSYEFGMRNELSGKTVLDGRGF